MQKPIQYTPIGPKLEDTATEGYWKQKAAKGSCRRSSCIIVRRHAQTLMDEFRCLYAALHTIIREDRQGLLCAQVASLRHTPAMYTAMVTRRAAKVP